MAASAQVNVNILLPAGGNEVEAEIHTTSSRLSTTITTPVHGLVGCVLIAEFPMDAHMAK
jgi:hypothetical protein